ncbi:ArsR/SmtB family transcription factor [Nocardioides pinisoli]|uniref:Metalloregulator ArsR/SmtB family transcription factor n=1 Tax=Nocardioides pinisoli TaxID=2950279 RepID=A0ABT1KYR3_9ACTN|nr:metalloregulator ArsR/SmtB family transcription factor [Nocardioides pinisoli]MCP3422897.1 metalloregulator ArsR/SmtB family transcription factor [Nocardioides pinisoli]
MDPFAALGDPVRRDLVVRLAQGPARVVDLTADHAISRPAISRHLRVLAEAGLVEAEDRGRERHYRLRREGLAALGDWLAALEGSGAPRPRFTTSDFDGLDLEVRRTGRERRAATEPAPGRPTSHPSPPQEDTA